MTERKPYDQLMMQLSSLHEQAMSDHPQREQQRQTTWREQRQRVVREVVMKQPSITARAKLRAVLRFALSPAFASGAMLPALLWLALGTWRSNTPRSSISPEPVAASAPSHVAVAAAPVPVPSTSPIPDPCVHQLHANGNEPLIDDFEDNNPLIAAHEGRVGLWFMYKDTDSTGTSLALTPSLRPQVSRGNHYALHVVGEELRDWGAVVQFDLQPSCYDASAYAGIAFSAKGPGRVYASVREVRVVPVQFGGTCTEDCYNAHQKKIDLTAQWKTYAITWNELLQRGYAAPALDPSRIRGIGFLVMNADTPFDLWFDDIKFIKR